MKLRSKRFCLCCLCGISITSRLRAEEFGLFNYNVVRNGNAVEITGYSDSADGPVEIPNEIAGLPVTGIGQSAFSRHALVTGIAIPDTVTSIGVDCFSDCSSLTDITVPGSINIISYR